MTGRLPTEACVQNLSAGQQLLLEYGFRKFETEQWTRLERVLGTFWEWTDVYNSKTGRPLEEETPVPPGEVPPTPDADGEMRLPLALVLKPDLLQLIRKRLRPPARLRREGEILEGSELSKAEFLELFGQAIKQVPQAAAAIQESMKPKSSFSRSPGPQPPRRPGPVRPPARPPVPASPAGTPLPLAAQRKPPTPR